MIRMKKEMNNKLTTVYVGSLELYFSYETIIGFKRWDQKPVLSENVWTQTTGRHLNNIDPDKKYRVDHKDFVGILEDVVEEAGL